MIKSNSLKAEDFKTALKGVGLAKSDRFFLSFSRSSLLLSRCKVSPFSMSMTSELAHGTQSYHRYGKSYDVG
jgi:hypothetical protein